MTSLVLEALARHAGRQPDRTALAHGAHILSYAALSDRVAGAMASMARWAGSVVGLGVADPIDSAVADLAALGAGVTLVPVPLFFSHRQVRHLLSNAGCIGVLYDAAAAPLVANEGYPWLGLDAVSDASADDLSVFSKRIIYTSGTTGTPKGVIHGRRQLDHAVLGLSSAVAATADDRHASLLPQSMLLEQIAGLHLPIYAGAEVHYGPAAASALARGDAGPAIDFLDRCRPTTTIIVPRQLAALVAGYSASGARAPSSLRLVAIGGAALSADLAERAHACGLPVREGYGLSECCSVVALQRSSHGAAGSVGAALDGTEIRIVDDEIVVFGPTVMDGYVGGRSCNGIWRTGDLGRLDADGNLVVLGRRDEVLVTSLGRNVFPQWVEGTLDHVSGQDGLAVTLDEDGEIVCIVETETGGAGPLAALQAAADGLPAYARPARWFFTRTGTLAAAGLFSGNGKLLRPALRDWYRALPHSPFSTIEESSDVIAL